ncbi:MAG: HlyD family efflux transporter periplasmic adaptor subunit [Acidobacteria bacterium]|nr:HlyD family efflux transporter periplasmic adaptor subunit [Acidobacteriota bacterium]
MRLTRNLRLPVPAAQRMAVYGRPAQVSPPHPRRPRSRFALWLVAVLIAAGALALLYRNESTTIQGRASPVAIRTVTVRSGNLEQTLRLTGTTAAENSMLLRAPYLRGRRSGGSGDFGLVLEELAASGKRVNGNEIVAAFDRLSMLNRLDDYRAARLERQLRLRTMLADLEVKRAAYRQQVRGAKARMDKAALDLKTAPVRSAIQVALFQLAFEESKAAHEALLAQAQYVAAGEQADLRLAQLELQEAQLEERRAEANVARMVVRAPVAGLVVISEIFRGAEFGQIQAGDLVRPDQPFMQIVDSESMIVAAVANQADVENLSIGARAHAHFDAFSDLELPARVYSIGPLSKGRRWRANFVSEVQVFLKLDRVDARLIPNLTVGADVIVDSERSEGIVPREAVFHDPERGQPFAYVRTPSGWEKRELELGLTNHIAVAVRSGVSAGDVVAVNKPSA